MLPSNFEILEGGALVIQRCELWRYNAIALVSRGEAVVVDPGITPDEITALREYLGGAGATVTHVVLTHSHHDHIRGWMAFPGARIVMPRVGADKPATARARILAGKDALDQKLGIQDPDFVYPEVDVRVDDRFAFTFGDLTVEVRALPGHSNCTTVVLVHELATLLSADYVVHPGLPYCRFEAAAFEEAHRRMRAWTLAGEVRRIVPGHEGILGGREDILAAIDLELEYFEVLRQNLRARLAAGEAGDVAAHAAAKSMATWRAARLGDDVGRRGVQDFDNAQRVLAELAP